MSVNVVTFSSTGGAGNVAGSLVLGFQKIGVEARLLYALQGNLWKKPFANPLLTFRASLDNYVARDSDWPSLVSLTRDQSSAQLKSALSKGWPYSELTIFRWMNGLLGDEFLSREPVFKKLAWGLDDMNPFTGACHYADSCRGFQIGCHLCPAVVDRFQDAVHINLARKIEFAKRYDPTYVAPTDWIHAKFQSSKLGQDRDSIKIPNPLREGFLEIAIPRTSSGKKIRVILVAADLDDPIKGVWDIIDVLIFLNTSKKFSLSLAGKAGKRLRRALPEANFRGSLEIEDLINEFQNHDVLLVPSLSENAGTVVAEAASQGTPSIARNVGGMPEMTSYGDTGFLFENTTELLELINSLSLADLSSKGTLAREWAQQLRPESIATKYAEAFLN